MADRAERLHRLPNGWASAQKGMDLKINRKGVGFKPGIRSLSVNFGLSTLYEKIYGCQRYAREVRYLRADRDREGFR
jgi:hypothetical protein